MTEPVQRHDWRAEHLEHLTIGQRAADVMRNGMGSWPFIAVFVSLMLLWALINTIALHDSSWDPYPYILLNLVLSMLAGLQGAILLIAAKRQDAISAAMARHDFETDTAAKQEIDRLLRLNEQQLTLILDLKALLEERLPPGGRPAQADHDHGRTSLRGAGLEDDGLTRVAKVPSSPGDPACSLSDEGHPSWDGYRDRRSRRGESP